ncbi:general transcription factor 3C polypeptide 5 isoform X2 [Dunckerocampus dactyliophorus]|uniref:general transcription factor 3C polypeptide 5 isoform X2 n=1 Tax=Dunckerocampus dactyliophorus TaxID=161453 RepID=UPI00240665BC|nr:general transcription factor 3C polypeptide 5 isoform X2 [Dunckerocampus dactyliophorus]
MHCVETASRPTTSFSGCEGESAKKTPELLRLKWKYSESLEQHINFKGWQTISASLWIAKMESLHLYMTKSSFAKQKSKSFLSSPCRTSFHRPSSHVSTLPWIISTGLMQTDFQSKTNFIGLNRARRAHNAIFVSYTDPIVPTECIEAAKVNWTRICVRDHDKQAEEKIVAMFESRPIWSRNAVKANIDIHPEKLKALLPVFAYYMVTGPWRSLWVKLGYDPRKTVESKIYQMLDYRLRCSTRSACVLSDLLVKPKRSTLNYTLPIAINKTGPTPASVTDLPTQEGSSTSRDPVRVSYQLKESSYIFREGMLPPHRQMFYQLCDLDVPRIQEVIQQNSGAEQICNERDGWCAVGTTDKLRDLISAMVKKVIRAQRPPLPKVPKRPRRAVRSSKVDAEDLEDDDDDDDEEEEDEDDEYQPSEGSENEMETEILDYM